MKRLAYLFAMPALLSADWKIVTRTGASTLTEYFKGSLTRTDSSPAYTTVIDWEHRRQVNWRNDLRQYEIVEWPPEVRPNASGPAVVIEQQTTDTGERKQFFGRTARHLVSRVLPGNIRHYESVSEVTELFERPLRDTLFQLPDGYQRVTNLPYAASRPAAPTWAELIRERWQKITDWFSALF